MTMFCGSFRMGAFSCRGQRASFRGHGVEVYLLGYVANANDLGRRFAQCGGSSDAELVALAYRKYDVSFPTIVFGEFAAVVYDPAERRLLLSTDSLGLVPLFYAFVDNGVCFGTDASDLARAASSDTIDEDYVAAFLSAADEVGDHTIFRSVRRVEQGCLVDWRDRTWRVVSVHDPGKATQAPPARTVDYVDGLRALTIEAVSNALPKTGKTWCELSGGLDSSTVVSVAAGVLHAPIETFSLVFSRSRRADEAYWIDAVLKDYPVPNHRLDGDEYPLFMTLPSRKTGEPSGGSISEALLDARNALLRDNHVDVVLTGMCGDAVFVGDAPEPYYMADLRNPFAILREARRWAVASTEGRPAGYWLRRYAVRPHFEDSPTASVAAPPAWIGPAIVTRWPKSERRLRRTGSIGADYYWSRVLRGARQIALGQPWRPGEPRYRNPLLYLPLVEYMAAAPWHEKLRPDLDRSLQRRALRDILPERVRQRRGKRVPSQALLARLAHSTEWTSLLSDHPEIIERGFVDGDRWREVVRLASLGHCRSVAPFLRACMLEAWFALRRASPNEGVSPHGAA